MPDVVDHRGRKAAEAMPGHLSALLRLAIERISLGIVDLEECTYPVAILPRLG